MKKKLKEKYFKNGKRSWINFILKSAKKCAISQKYERLDDKNKYSPIHYFQKKPSHEKDEVKNMRIHNAIKIQKILNKRKGNKGIHMLLGIGCSICDIWMSGFLLLINYSQIQVHSIEKFLFCRE